MTSPDPLRLGRRLGPIFFLSGASGLAFETLWFRLAGLSLGNSVWASSMVLSSFMGGLALGTWLVGRHGGRVHRPIRLYAGLEVLIGLAGLGLVLLLPELPRLLTPVFSSLLENPLPLNTLRFGIGFVLLTLPAAAMGATLPLLVLALCRGGTRFGTSLGMLYGCNTLGAVAGTLAAELVLVRAVGVWGTGLLAALANLVAAGLALRLSRGEEAPATEATPAPAPPGRLGRRGVALLAAAALAGALLLALEVVWFRLMLLFTFGSSQAFALMLAVVLAGIGLGGLFAARLSDDAPRQAPLVACLSGIILLASYLAFATGMLDWFAEQRGLTGIIVRAVWLAGPVTFASGVLFTLIGQSLQRRLAASERSSGYLTVANTLGAMLGALLGGVVLLPRLGIDGSLFVLALGYGGVALLLVRWPLARDRHTALVAGCLALLATGAVLFPHGLLERSVLRGRLGLHGEVAAVREGLTETAIYVRQDRFGQPHAWQLLTNGYAMSAANTHAKQYMKLYVYLPVALHPDPRRALLICYGVGSTAKALTDTASLRQIDVVDISRDILELNALVYPDPADHPLHDPRVVVHIEDGRFYLQTTDQTYDLITAEPPPPHGAGVGNLYSREYFQLVHDRLAPGGMATYWLPLTQMDESESRAIIRAFLDVFTEASLWMGSGPEWMLFGVRGPARRVTAEEFARPWSDPVVGPEIVALGFEHPEQLGAYFLDDADGLAELCRDSPPLVDDHPYRLYPVPRRDRQHESRYRALLEPEAAWRRFRDSEHIARLWPAGLVAPSRPYFAHRVPLNDVMYGPPLGDDPHPLVTVHRVLTTSDLVTLPLWLLGSDADEQRIVDAVGDDRPADPRIPGKRGDRALAERRYADAAAHYAESLRRGQATRSTWHRRILALALAGDRLAAGEAVADLLANAGGGRREAAFLGFLAATFGIEAP